MSFYSIPTLAGLAELADALVDQQAVPFTHLAVGDGNGAPVVPDPNQVAMVNQVAQFPITRIFKHPDNPTWFCFEAAVSEEVGGWDIHEVGVKGGRVPGILMAVGNHPKVEKPADATMLYGGGLAMILRVYVAYADGAAINMTVDSMAYATLGSVQDLIDLHKAEADPHPQYLTKAEADAFYDSIGLAAAAIDLDAARLSAHVVHADPHPQYINAARQAASTAGDWAEQFFNA